MTTQQIGKYRIIERIGRGGMGSVYKAHDPVLDRLVALKVVSAETDHTEELRARFFREAQACAKLSHPNVVTIHDLGEADGNLFIVMELLEGEELRQLIARRAIVHLEDKFPLMIQICDGLEYAHEKGIVHRDVKPGNIFVLRNGQVKILDFGIAHIAAAETGLTRAGLIVGTLQYMAPERARGQGGHLSDIFSVGAVFYELLTNRQPFAGGDPIEILEKLRNEDPPRLDEVDPTLPTELGAIVARALEKDPAKRFATLGQMRAELLLARRRLADDAERVRRDVQSRLSRLHELREALATRLGGPWADETVFVVDERAPLATLENVGRDTTTKIERMQELLARAESLRPALDSGLEALRNGDFERAVAQLDRVVGEMPEHASAAESLREAQHHLDAQHRHGEQLATLVREARAAHEAGEYARCLEALERLAEQTPPGAVPAEALELRRSAEAALARERQDEALRREAQRRASESAREMLERSEQARRSAEAADARRYQRAIWDSAEAKLAEGQAALAEEAYAPGERHFAEARLLYQRAEAGAREAQAAAVDAARRAEELADEARRLIRDTAHPASIPSSDETVFVSTSRVPVETPVPVHAPTGTQVELSASAGAFPVSSSRRPSLSARTRRHLTMSVAGGVGLAVIAVGLWVLTSRAQKEDIRPEPVQKETVQQEGVQKESLQAEDLQRERAQRESVAQLQGTVLAARDRAIKADSGSLAGEVFSRAQSAQKEGDRLVAERNLTAAMPAYKDAADRYAEAERQAQTKREQRAGADAARAQMTAAKQRAAPDAASFPRALDAERQGNAMYAQQSYADAAATYRAATELFAKAVPAPEPPPPSNPRTAIRGVLDSYARAFATKDLSLLRRVRPGLTEDELRRWRASNEIKRSHKIDLTVYEITITGSEAQALGRREDVVILNSGQRYQTETRFAFTLKQGSGGWVIDEIRESADRPAETRTPRARAPRR